MTASLGEGSLSAPPLPLPPADGTRNATLVRAYLGVHALALLAYWFVPIDTWPHVLWQMSSAAFSASFMVLGARRQRTEAALGWYLIAAGVFLNAWGVVVDLAMERFVGVRTRPNPADIFWSAQFPTVVLGLTIFARRVAAREDLGVMLRNTLIAVPVAFFAGIYAWQLVVLRFQQTDSVTVTYRIVISSYPFGNLTFMALLLRLVLGIGLRNVSLVVMLVWWTLLLPSDLGWPMALSAGILPSRAGQYLMEASWMTANALLGAASWHPSAREITRSEDGQVAPLGALGWVCLLACVLAAPAVVILQLVLDHLYSLTSF